MDGRMDDRTKGRKEECMDGWRNERKKRAVEWMDEWMIVRKKERRNVWMDGETNGRNGRLNGWTNGRSYERKKGGMYDGWRNERKERAVEWMDEWMIVRKKERRNVWMDGETNGRNGRLNGWTNG